MLINFDHLFDKCGIKSGDKILVSSDILKILIFFKKNKKKFNASAFIKKLKKRVGKNGTILFPTYNWDFCNGADFNFKKTISKTGSLSNFALKERTFKRSLNPIYSFAVWGKDQDYICNLEHQSCFDLNSPFGYLIENNGKCLFIGMDYKDGFTFVHVAEEAVGVNFRYFKEFSGNCIVGNRKKFLKYKMYVRDKDSNYITGISDKLDNILIKKKAYKKIILNEINLGVIDIKKTYNTMVEDLKKDKVIVYQKRISGK